MALGIYYLHCCRPAVLHLDLKSANVLLDDYGRAKVCDFGLAHLKEEHGVLTSRMGSPMWTAPEILKGEAATETADSYSFAMLLYEIISRRLPYVGIPAPQARQPAPRSERRERRARTVVTVPRGGADHRGRDHEHAAAADAARGGRGEWPPAPARGGDARLLGARGGGAPGLQHHPRRARSDRRRLQATRVGSDFRL